MTLIDRVNLPDEVRARLGSEQLDAVSARVKNRLEESRQVGHVEIRATDDGTIGVEGYAATWGVPYDVAGGPALGGWVETIEAGAVDRALTEAPDIRFLVNHDSGTAFGLPLARTAAKTLEVSSDRVGLHVVASSLDPLDPVVQHFRSALAQGNVDQMSWAFRVSRQEWNEDYTERRVMEVSQAYDVSAVAYPANDATIIGLRSDEEQVAEKRGMSLALARMYQTED